MTYLRSRGFRDDIIKKFQLGYSLDSPDALAKAALQKGYKEEFLVKTGLCYRKDNGTLHDRFWGRVIFPVHTLSGKVVAFGGRVLSAATKNVQMKYVNSPESEIYHKSRELYGIYFAKQAIVRQDRCFLVEGYTDVISMHQSGIENVVASSGTALTADQIRLIHRFTNNITVLYDGDGAGIKASIRGIDMLLEEGMNIKVCLLPDGDDPDSFARKHNATDYQAYINDHEVDFIRFKTNLLMEEAGKDPIKRASLISSIVKSISVIPDAIVRSVYIRECSQLLQMEEKILVEATAKLIEQAREINSRKNSASNTGNGNWLPMLRLPIKQALPRRLLLLRMPLQEKKCLSTRPMTFLCPLLQPKASERVESRPIFLLLKQWDKRVYLHLFLMKFRLIPTIHISPPKEMSRKSSTPRKKI